MKINPKGGYHWEKLKLTNVFSFNSVFFLGGDWGEVVMWRGWGCLGMDALPFIWNKGSSECCCKHTTVHWMTRWPFLGKGKKIFSGAKTCKCISLLFLSRKIHTHKGRTLLSDKRKKKESKKNKLKTWVKTLVWTNKGLIFTSKKVKVTRLVLTVSLYGTKEYTTKPVAHVSQLAAGLKMVEFNWLWRMNYPYVWTKKPLNLISPGQKHNYIPSAMCDSAQNANFNLFCTFEHTQKPIWFSLK